MEFSAEWAVQAGGWDPRYAVVLAVASRGDVAAALIDTNGDGADIDLDEYASDADGLWDEAISGSAGAGGSSWSQRVVAIWGRAEPAASIEVEYRGVESWWSRPRPGGGCSSRPRQTIHVRSLGRSAIRAERPSKPRTRGDGPWAWEAAAESLTVSRTRRHRVRRGSSGGSRAPGGRRATPEDGAAHRASPSLLQRGRVVCPHPRRPRDR